VNRSITATDSQQVDSVCGRRFGQLDSVTAVFGSTTGKPWIAASRRTVSA